MSKAKRRIVLSFPAESVNEPVTYRLIKDHDVMVNILNADITHGKEGKLLVEISGEKKGVDSSMAYLESLEVDIAPAIKTIAFRQEECIHCGACSAVCFSGALVLHSLSRELEFHPEKCVACELCIKACPLHLFELNFGPN